MHRSKAPPPVRCAGQRGARSSLSGAAKAKAWSGERATAPASGPRGFRAQRKEDHQPKRPTVHPQSSRAQRSHRAGQDGYPRPLRVAAPHKLDPGIRRPGRAALVDRRATTTASQTGEPES
eukprot:284788-Pyramimonas_sp.AAC.1